MEEINLYTELIPLFETASFVLKTQQQISKDFAKFNLIFPANFEEVAYAKPEIEQLISEQLVDLMKEGETRLLQLLYTIDLSEKEFLSITTNANFLPLLSEKILYREAYKIFLRAKFS
jgi:hypothetical protein